jgi:hypothetical protein
VTTGPLYVDRPQAGFYKTKLVKGGPWVGVRIWWDYPIDPVTGETMDRSPVLKAETAGKPSDPYEIWTWCAGRPITETEYRDMRPVEPEQAVDFNSSNPVF